MKRRRRRDDWGGWDKGRQASQPEESTFSVVVAEQERVYALRGSAEKLVCVAERIFDRDALDVAPEERGKERQGRNGVRSAGWVGVAGRACVREELTRRVSYQQVPTVVEYPQRVALDMLPWCFGWQQVARPGVVAACGECVADPSGELARNEYSHAVSLPHLAAGVKGLVQEGAGVGEGDGDDVVGVYSEEAKDLGP